MRHGVDFFRDEIKNGFYVPTAVKQSWAAALDVLSVINDICKKHGITYYADWGSFLGALRHGGYVPWDDDLDICMKRDDYEKFRSVADAELPENYCIHDYERQQNHWLFLARVVNNRHISFDEKYLKENYNFPWLSGVDIFLKDYLYKDKDKEKKRCDAIMHLLAKAEPILETDREKAIALYHEAEKLMSEVPKSEEDEIGQIFQWILKGGNGEEKESYEKVELLPFEDTYIPVPYKYNKVLRRRYRDYNVIRKGVAGHDYPAFEGQRKAFEEESGVKIPHFEFNIRMLERPKVEVLKEKTSRREAVLFLPVGPREWESMEPTFMREAAGDDTEVYVIPLPLMPKDYFGNVDLTDEEIIEAVELSKYPDYVQEAAFDFLQVDLESAYFDRIYFQNPYDEWNPVLTIPPYYYSESLRFCTGELIYIPLGPVGEFSDNDIPDIEGMNFYVTMPGAVYADRILVQSENIRKHYIDKLFGFAAGSDRSYWENKIVVDDALYNKDGSFEKERTKRILFGVSSYEFYENEEGFESALRSRMEIFKENKECVRADILIYPELASESRNLSEKYRRFNEIVVKMADEFEIGIKRGAELNLPDTLNTYEAYYGSSMPLVHRFVACKKPVMLADYSI